MRPQIFSNFIALSGRGLMHGVVSSQVAQNPHSQTERHCHMHNTTAVQFRAKRFRISSTACPEHHSHTFSVPKQQQKQHEPNCKQNVHNTRKGIRSKFAVTHHAVAHNVPTSDILKLNFPLSGRSLMQGVVSSHVAQNPDNQHNNPGQM